MDAGYLGISSGTWSIKYLVQKTWTRTMHTATGHGGSVERLVVGFVPLLSHPFFTIIHSYVNCTVCWL